MKYPKFIEEQKDGYFEYHLPVPYERFISPLISADSLAKLEKNTVEELSDFIADNNISSFGAWDENTVLYYLALRILSKNRKCFLVYFSDPENIENVQENSNPLKAEWRYSIQFTEGQQFCECFGFQSPGEFLQSVNYSDKDLSRRYFYLAEIDEENLKRYTGIYASDVTNWFFIFCEPENEQNIISMLTNRDERPDLKSLLKYCSATVNIQIGGDEGYLDYLLIQSATDLSSLMKEIERKQQNFIEEYHSLLMDCKPFDDEWKVDFYKDRYLEIIKGSLS